MLLLPAHHHPGSSSAAAAAPPPSLCLCYTEPLSFPSPVHFPPGPRGKVHRTVSASPGIFVLFCFCFCSFLCSGAKKPLQGLGWLFLFVCFLLRQTSFISGTIPVHDTAETHMCSGGGCPPYTHAHIHCGETQGQAHETAQETSSSSSSQTYEYYSSTSTHTHTHARTLLYSDDPPRPHTHSLSLSAGRRGRAPVRARDGVTEGSLAVVDTSCAFTQRRGKQNGRLQTLGEEKCALAAGNHGTTRGTHRHTPALDFTGRLERSVHSERDRVRDRETSTDGMRDDRTRMLMRPPVSTHTHAP